MMRICVVVACVLTSAACTDETDAPSIDDTDFVCAMEAEPCIGVGEPGVAGGCCNGRHTCFDEGCFYTDPSN